ncbi:MAG: hypothetical protein C5B59_16110 [Bacteroidetes bacterium]|nr:MAG: hypothetical protein C5B59_16110 [Bacteroidota bacterium]
MTGSAGKNKAQSTYNDFAPDYAFIKLHFMKKIFLPFSSLRLHASMRKMQKSNLMSTASERNPATGDEKTLLRMYNMDSKKMPGISYEKLSDSWYAISGGDEEKAYCHKAIIKNGLLHNLRLVYPKNQKPLFESLLPRISKSFR